MQESTESNSMSLPALRRAIDLFPIESNGRSLIGLRDRADPSAPTICLDDLGRRVASLLDGARSVHSVCAAYALRWPERLRERDVLELVAALDDANLLESDRHRERQANLMAALPVGPGPTGDPRWRRLPGPTG